MVGALRAGQNAARRARRSAQGDRAGAQGPAGPGHVWQADDQGDPGRLDRGGAGLEQARDCALEEVDRRGEDRPSAVTRRVTAKPAPARGPWSRPRTPP